MIEALYLHIPFCVSRCAYCDFATSACDDDARMDAYVDALCVQLRRAARELETPVYRAARWGIQRLRLW